MITKLWVIKNNFIIFFPLILYQFEYIYIYIKSQLWNGIKSTLSDVFCFLHHLSMNISGFNQKSLIKDSCGWFIFRDSGFLSGWLCVFFVTSQTCHVMMTSQLSGHGWVSPLQKALITWPDRPEYRSQTTAFSGFSAPRRPDSLRPSWTNINATRQPHSPWDQRMGQDQQIWWTFGNNCTMKFSWA